MIDSLGRKINEGSYEDGLKTGEWKEWDYSAKEYRKIRFQKDEIHGKVVWIHFDGYIILEGEFKMGVKNGVWTWYYPLGKIKSQGKFVNGKEEGRHIWYTENGEIEAYADYENGKVIKN